VAKFFNYSFFPFPIKFYSFLGLQSLYLDWYKFDQTLEFFFIFDREIYMTKISTSNKIVEGVKPAIKAYLDKAELNKSAQQVAGKLRGHQARLTLNIHRQVFIGTSTITDAGSTVSNGDGLDTFLSQPKLVKGVKAEDRLDVITSYAREVMNAVYLEWEGQALKEENQLVRVAEVKNIHRQRLMFNQIAWILARGDDSQKALIRKELKARDQ